MMTVTAFSIERFVIRSRGRRFALTASISTRADAAVESIFSWSGFAIVDEPISDSPSASNDELIVLAVYMPPHEPADGQAFSSIAEKSSRDSRPAVNSPTASNTDTIVRSRAP